MGFGGHETFAIREGWLHKGVKLLLENPEQLVDENACDFLGVGRNMAKSIRHWLVATGLAQPCHMSGKSMLTTSDLGKLVLKHDPYFSELGTWWALHVNLVNCSDHALTWTWFFNSFNFDRFDRSVCLESLKRHLELSKQRMPSPRTLERDVACLLASYARIIPSPDDDPEEDNDCPLRELALLSFFKTSGYYQLHQGRKDIPAELFGYALSKAFRDAVDGTGSTDITLLDAARAAGGPGRAFVLTAESLFEVATHAESSLTDNSIEIVGLAGNDEVSVWHGTDLDLRGRLEEERRRVADDFNLVAFLTKEAKPPAWKPVEYNDDYCIWRYLTGAYLRKESFDSIHSWAITEIPADSDGRIVYLITDNYEDLKGRGHALSQLAA